MINYAWWYKHRILAYGVEFKVNLSFTAKPHFQTTHTHTNTDRHSHTHTHTHTHTNTHKITVTDNTYIHYSTF